MKLQLTMRQRQYLYTIAMMVVPLLVAYDALEPERAPLWLAVAAAFLGLIAPATALQNLAPGDRDIATAPEPEIEER